MICVLNVLEGPASGMKCWLKVDQRITIGRIGQADFSIPTDPHLSRHHLVVEGTETGFRLRDIGSSNGTFVNETPIAVVQLCAGDRIRAGGSLFRVEFQADQNDERGEFGVAGSIGSDFPVIPTRTISKAGSTGIEQDLAPGVLESNPELIDASIESRACETEPTECFLFAPVGNQADSSGATDASAGGQSTRGTGNATNSDDDRDESIEDEPTENSANSGLNQSSPPTLEVPAKQTSTEILRAFEPEPDSRLRYLRGEKAIWQTFHLIEALAGASDYFRLNLLVNRVQLDAREMNTLDFSLAEGETRQLTETLFLLQSERREHVMAFYKRCLGRDAATCIGSESKLNDHWLRGNIDVLSYPSLLHSVIRRDNDGAARVLHGVRFIIFENSVHTELCLLS